MKTNIYILLILLLSFSVANAQENTTAVKAVTVNELNVNTFVLKTAPIVSTIQNSASVDVNENTKSTTQVIARSASDIRIFLNRERNLENIDLLFPKIYKEEMA
ncbi:hypothetical protein [Yeosuana marina]|uniref:hypothetical protein n=1 Tax=Yeosuana marina TaxID=1565536 RepID=UPI0030EE4FCC|tara:strand:- start:372 stop:683 length:312 start_codon:yes stop_codon:yes gene_type:complete